MISPMGGQSLVGNRFEAVARAGWLAGYGGGDRRWCWAVLGSIGWLVMAEMILRWWRC